MTSKRDNLDIEALGKNQQGKPKIPSDFKPKPGNGPLVMRRTAQFGGNYTSTSTPSGNGHGKEEPRPLLGSSESSTATNETNGENPVLNEPDPEQSEEVSNKQIDAESVHPTELDVARAKIINLGESPEKHSKRTSPSESLENLDTPSSGRKSSGKSMNERTNLPQPQIQVSTPELGGALVKTKLSQVKTVSETNPFGVTLRPVSQQTTARSSGCRRRTPQSQTTIAGPQHRPCVQLPAYPGGAQRVSIPTTSDPSASQKPTQPPKTKPPTPVHLPQKTKPKYHPTIPPITPDLEKILNVNPTTQKILFHTKSTASRKRSSWKWGDSSFVRVPFSPENNKRWAKIQSALEQLKANCENGLFQENPAEIGRLMMQGILLYNANTCNSDFKLLSNDQTLSTHILKTLPKIVDLALLLPKLLANPIPILSKDSNKTIHVSKILCSSLLANAFFCTLPEGWDDMPDINFIRLFDLSEKPEKANVKGEKLMCLLNYFHQIHTISQSEVGKQETDKLANCILSFRRRCLKQAPNWKECSKQLIPVIIDSTGKIEDKHEMLQVDFANKIVGGGVIGNGAVMEEIRFSICPELIVSRIFTAPLEDNEVLFIKGSQQFSSHSGYAASFKYTGPVNQSNLPKDNLNRMVPEVVCMDALHFKPNELSKQFKTKCINRELHKCSVAFRTEASPSSPIATGNWGCGAFNGDSELKFLIQWIAASEAERESVYYFTIGDKQQQNDILKIVGFLKKARIDVQTLYMIVLQFYDEHFHCDSIFDFVVHWVKTKRKSRA